MKEGRYWLPAAGSVALLVMVAGLCGLTAAATITATIGETVPLNGTVQLIDTVYLFVTGPGIPVNGARMDNSNAPVVTGDPDTFTQVMVSNDRWAYSWNTGRVSGGLAPGTHTVYVSTQPVAANALSGVLYGEVDVLLQKPVTTGTIDVTTDPADAQILLNGKYAGNSPRVFDSLTPGDYAIRLEKQGYATVQDTVTLAAGDRVQFTRTLPPLAVPPAGTAVATPVSPAMGGGSPTPSPTQAPLLPLGVIAGFVVACLVRSRWS